MHQSYKNTFFLFAIAILGCMVFFANIGILNAADVEQIRDKIDQKTEEIKKLETEINQYQKDLNVVSTQKVNLQNEVKTLDISKKKIETDIKVTSINIEKTVLTIEQLASEIKKKQSEIDEKLLYLTDSVKNIRIQDDVSVVERLLANESISDYIETTENFTDKLGDQIKELEIIKGELAGKRSAADARKTDLAELKTELSGKKQSVVQTQAEKDKLLTVTKNQESNYQKILAEKKALKEQFEKDLFSYQEELKIAIDPSKYPKPKNSILAWPLKSIYITQLFGKTGFSARLYTSGTHNGVDFRASDGTAVMASLGGTVTAIGNTDATKGCYSYGKWILIKHPNGLSTLYAHLSSINVDAGESVALGQVIGYSGRTGYVTGPHLHLTVLATEGVRVMAIPNEKTVNCRGVVIPLADTKAFLDPMIYLPKI